MRARHTPHALPAFPVYSSAFLSDNELVLGGGGGASRSGIKNKLVCSANLAQLILFRVFEIAEAVPCWR